MRKYMKLIFVILFLVILFIPIILFNRNKDAVSEIDNKVLAQNPLSPDAEPVDDLTEALSQYVSERIGLRNQMILAYTQLNDKLFNEMVHPTYAYGKDGYIFFKPNAVKTYGAFQEAFVNLICEIQKYCEDRDIPFVFVFEPSKTSILREYLPDGYNYNNEWVDTFFDRLRENNINFVDNTQEMLRCKENQIEVFNVKYNAGHWNDVGAFYGMNQVLTNLKKRIQLLHVNDMSEYEITQKLNTTLQVSQFPISEYEPIFNLIDSECIKDITGTYSGEIQLDSQYRHFLYLVNEKRVEENAPKALVFQGSYINGMGYKFLENAFAEYIQVHDYQNILNFQYYVDIFNPDCVIFEVAEYTFSNDYFNQKKMQEFKLAPLSSAFVDYAVENVNKNDRVEAEQGSVLTTIRLTKTNYDCDYAYAFIKGREYNMQKCHDDSIGKYYYELIITNENYDEDDIEFMLVDTENEIKYYVK